MRVFLQKLREANEQITLLRREAEVSERATVDLQRQLEAAHRLDYSSVYESVDNLHTDRLADASRSQVSGGLWGSGRPRSICTSLGTSTSSLAVFSE